MSFRYLFALLISLFLFSSSAYADCQPPQYFYTSGITHQSANLSWSYYGSSSPSYQIQWHVAGNTSWNTTPALTTSTYSLTGLTNDTNYEWRIRTVCVAGDTSAFTVPSGFRTICALPSYLSTTRVAPQSIRLSWSTPYGGMACEVQWRPAGTTTWTVVSDITNNLLTLNGLAPDTYFEWRVRTVCSASITSDFVNGPLFNTQCLVPTNTQTTLTGPDAAELKWVRPVAGVRFDLQWRPAGASTWNVVEGISDTEYILAGLSNETAYEWQVRSVCSAGSKSDFTEVQVLRTRCPVPLNLAPSLVTHNEARLQWTAIAPVTLQWRPAGTADWTTVAGVRSPYTLTGLAINTTYEWRLQTVCTASATSLYTPVQVLTTRCITPTNLIASLSDTGDLMVMWTMAATGIVELQWRALGAPDWTIVTGILNTYYTVTGLDTSKQYEWRIRQACSATDQSDFVTGPAAQILCNAPYFPQQENSTNTSMDLTWEDAGGGTYELQWRPVNAAAWTTVSGLVAKRYTLTGLTANVLYEWHVRKVCSDTKASLFTYTSNFVSSCGQPTSFGASNVDYSSATLGWSGNNSYPLYELQYRPVGTTDWTLVGNLTTTVYSLTGLIGNTTYEWRVRAICSANETANFSATQTFRTQCNQTFSLMGAQSIDETSAEIYWSNTGNTTQYEIQYRDVTTQNWIVLQPELIGTGVSSSRRQYTLYGLVPGKTYTWRVRIICTPSIYADFTDGSTFTTACAVPIYGSSVQQSSSSVLVSWYGNPLATNYELQWRPLGAATWTIVSGVTNKSYMLTNLTPGVNYECRVRHLCESGQFSDFSATGVFAMQCRGPGLINATILSTTSLRISWSYYDLSDIEVATRVHDLQYRVNGTSDWTTVTGIVGTAYSLTGLVNGTAYDYQVRATCQPGALSGYSVYGFIRLACPVVYPNSAQTGPTVATLSWSGDVNRYQQYMLRWRVVGESVWSVMPVTGNTYTLTGLTNGTTYEWSVATDCGNGYMSDYSSVQSFQTSCVSLSYLSISNVGANRAQIYWPVTGLISSATYTLQYRIKGAVVWSAISGITSQAVSLTGLESNVTYECRVQAVCGSTLISSDISSFQTQCANPYYSTPLTITAQSAILTWTNNVDNAPVDLQWRKTTNDSWHEVTGLTSTAYSLTGLTPGTSYEFRMRSVCSATDRAQYSYAVSFQTLSASGSLATYVNNVSALSAEISWPGVFENKTYRLQWRERNGNWNTTGPLTSRGYLLANLKPSTYYEVRVGYVDINDSLIFGTGNSFTTYCPQITYSSTTTITSKSALLVWTVVSLPVTVQWRVGGTSNWNSVTGVVGGTYTITGLTNNTVYEWRLLTPCSADIVSATYPATFRTLCLMPTSPYTQNVSSGSAQLTWTGLGPEYMVQYRTVGATAWTTVTSLTANAYTLRGLTANTVYEWAVATVCDVSSSTTFNSPIRFATQCSLPSNLGVGMMASDRAQLTWNGDEASYQLQWRVRGGSVWNTISAVTSPYTLTGLTTGITYEWRVRSSCAISDDGLFVTGYQFTVQCMSFYYDNKSAQTLTSNSVIVSWSANPLMTYQVRWRALGTAAWTNSPGSVGSPYTLTGLTNNTTYEWQILSECQPSYGVSSLFQTSCNAPGNLRTQNVITTSALLRWSDSGESAGYELQWRVAGTSSWTSISNINGTSYALTGLATNTTYDWQVRSQCSGGSAFQTTTSFKTADDCALGMNTVRAGSWDDPTVWSCGRIPTLTDRVQLNHALTVPSNYAAKVLTIRYETGARLSFGLGSTIRMGQ